MCKIESEQIQKLKKQTVVENIKELKLQTENLKTLITDRYAEGLGSECATQ